MSKKSIRYNTNEYVDLDVSLGEAIKSLQVLAKKYGDGAELIIDLDYDSITVLLYATRLETDEELDSRLYVEARHKERQLARDKMDYERLKKIFQPPKE